MRGEPDNFANSADFANFVDFDGFERGEGEWGKGKRSNGARVWPGRERASEAKEGRAREG